MQNAIKNLCQNILFIDGVKNHLRIGILDKFGNITSNDFVLSDFDNANGFSDIISYTMDSIFDKANMKINDIDWAIGVNGPGSFTGIRMVLGFLSGLKTSFNLQGKDFCVAPLSLFKAYLISCDTNKFDKNVAVVLKSNSKTVYAQIFSPDLKEITNPYEYSVDDFENLIKTYECEVITEDESLPDYDLSKILNYVQSNSEFRHNLMSVNIMPCYIRPHYAKPLRYNIDLIDDKDKTDSVIKKIVISNESDNVGFLEYQMADFDIAEIIDIEIFKEFQNKGAGKFLLLWFIAKMKECNCSKIFLEVNMKNSIALNLYEKIGFIKDSVRTKYYNNTDDALLMSLNLINNISE